MRVAIAFVLLCSSTALAQSVETAAVPDGAHSPGFVTIDRFSGVSEGGADFSYIKPNNGGDITLLSFDLHGQYVTPSGFGGYAQMPISYASGNGDSVTALGDLEAGILYVMPLGQQKVALHAGLTLPTAGDDLDETLIGIYGVAGSRLTDYYQAIPKGTSLRIGASPLIRSGSVFARFDIGLDANVDNSSDQSADTFLRFNAGVGFDLTSAAVMAELTNLYTTRSNPMADSGSNWINMMAVSARLKAGDLSPYAALIIPLDKDTKDLFDLTFTVGLVAAIH